MATLNIEPIHPDFGASITGVDLNAPLDEAVVEEIRVVIDEYSLVNFPDQHLDDDAHLAFTRLLGEPEASHVRLGQDGVVEYFGTIGNVLDDGSVLGNDHTRTKFQTGNNLWHSDSSFRKIPSYVSIMSVIEVPDEGGETEFISARAAYGRLPEDVKATIDPLRVVHDYVFSRSKVGPDAVTPSHAASLPPIEQKMVRANPRTGAKNHYVGSHAKTIAGWNEDASRALIDDLLERATQAEYVYSQDWRPGEVVIWDNRCLLHRGAGYDADKYRRRMRQTRVCGAGPTLDE
ncbi:MAG: TauD/TfdA family dioxygenase [Rhodospirillaceae bacterium]|nr:TauD/TfdA family dioxygenase [Rhodospirillaceae bacterium]MBT5665678.1 TauD/TfdA family dioxygenase [Rhodospirillaceae bacterium]MBT5811721.1 TauD/TfdA family dioxygenase [Rhodospirillaceae bacterium]